MYIAISTKCAKLLIISNLNNKGVFKMKSKFYTEQTARLVHSYSDVEHVAHSFKSSAHSEFDFTTRMLLNEKKKQKTYTGKY